MLSVSLLGDLCIRDEEKLVTDIDTPRLQSLLTYLVLHKNAPQSRAHLSFLFWPDTSEAQARTNLRNLLHHLRHVLPNPDSFLDISVQFLQWRSNASFSLDVDDFELALVRAEQALQVNDAVAMQVALEQAVVLYKGDLLPSCYDDWIIPKREGLRQQYLDSLDRLVHILEDKRDYQAAIRNAQLILRQDPLQEATYRNLIRLHALNDDRAGALRIYHTCTTILRRELDVAPSPATRDAYEQIMGAESRGSPTVPPITAFSPLVAREREWMQLLQAWQSIVTGGNAHVVAIRGEAGIGKTRLVEELVQWAGRQGIASASTRCYAAEGDLAYAPVSTWLRAHTLIPLEDVWLAEVARLLPEILIQRPDLPTPVALTEAWQRQRFFEALSRAILGTSQPLLLTIDDLQWCNRDTLEFIHFLLRFDREARLLVIGTYRPEEIGEGHPLAALLHAQRLEGQLSEIDLRPLDATATKTLATQIAGVEIGNEIAQHLYQETEGNPLFVVETMRVGLPDYNQKPDNYQPADSIQDEMGTPPKVRSMLEARLAQVSIPSRELGGLAATIGREFNFKLLAKASGCDEDTLIRRLDELWQRRIVREHGYEAYDFSHDKLREAAYYGMSTARRRLMHHHVAQALEELHAPDLNSVSHQLAAHYEHADRAEQAIPYYLRAAMVAGQVFANDEAIALLRHGLALVENIRLSASGGEYLGETTVQLWEGLGDVLELKVHHEEALQAFKRAQIQVPQGNQVWKARLHRKIGVVLREQRLYAQALDSYHQAEIALGKFPDRDLIDWWAEWIEVQVDQVWAHYWLAQEQEMEMLVNKVQPIVQARGSVASRARFLMATTLMLLRKHRYTISDEMMATQREALQLSREWGDQKTIVESQFENGFLHLWRRELDEAERNLRIALEMTENSGILYMQILSLTYLTVVCRFLGKLDAAQVYALQAQEMAEAAHMPAYVAAAKGNQAWLAWRRGDLPAAEQRGQEAIELWRQSPLVYPFRWLALWPLIGVAIKRGSQEEAWSHVQALLEPTQQRLPERLNSLLETAILEKERDQADAARSSLDQAMELALEMGYL